ncbi:MAG: diguanylate cyclase [Deltaproteobacteria bacterium]|nr:diguanylate cyclase [Deltaproteobacteria bacterium]
MSSELFSYPKHLPALLHSFQKIHSSLARSIVIESILKEGSILSGGAGTALALFREDRNESCEVFSRGLSETFTQSIPALTREKVRDVVSVDGCASFPDLPGSGKEEIESIYCFSLAAGEGERGILYFFRFQAGAFSKEEIGLLRFFAEEAGSALSNAEAFLEKERQIRQLNILNEATLSLSSEPSLDFLFQKLTDHAQFLLRSDASLLLLVEEDLQKIDRVYCAGDLAVESIDLSGGVGETLSGVLLAQHVLNLQSEDLAEKITDLPFPAEEFHHLLTVPIMHLEAFNGLLILLNGGKHGPFSPQDEDLILTYTFQTGLAIENARLQEYTRRLAITDGLTGLFNHREFQRRMEEEVRRCGRYGRCCSLLMLDIDHFKHFNDTYGHPVGDQVLSELAGILRKSTREMDAPARYGGEEFVVILPETEGEKAEIAAERIRKAIEGMKISPPGGGTVLRITVSIGVAAYPEDAETREELIGHSDQALYIAKRSGRNRVCRYEESMENVSVEEGS